MRKRDRNLKVCTPKCETPKLIKGHLFCLRDDIETAHAGNAATNSYQPDAKLGKINGPLSCHWPTCTATDFPDMLTDYILGKGWDVSLDETDFIMSAQDFTKGSLKAFLRYPGGAEKSKTKCICKMRKGKRKFKCSNLQKPKGC